MAGLSDWRDVFCGRDAELRQLMHEYDRASLGEGPRLVVICADRGMGKTRLVQEFYRHLAIERDPAGYWPRASLFSGNNLRVAPDIADADVRAHFESFRASERTMPFLWWGFRLADPTDHNAVRSDMAAHRRSLQPHLEDMRVERRALALEHEKTAKTKDAALTLGESLYDLVPGLGTVVNIFKSAKKILEARRAGRKAERVRKEFGGSVLAGVETTRSRDICDQTLDDLAELLRPKQDRAAVPAVVFCDDAQFAREGGDEGALRFLGQLWERAAEHRWPLLLVATHWAVDWEQDRGIDSPSFARSFADVAADAGRATVIDLPRQVDLGILVRQGIPGAATGDVELLLRKADGNPQVLLELIALIQRSPRWIRSGRLSDVGRRSIEKHSGQLTTLITDRLNSNATPPEVRVAVALSSIQGMQFLCDLTEAASRGLNLGPTSAGLAKAEDPMKLIAGLDAGVASFVQRAYRDAARSLVESQCNEPEEEVQARILAAAIAIVDDPVARARLAPERLRAMLGVVASLGEDSPDGAKRLRGGRALLELIELAEDNAQKAISARAFVRGLGSKWPMEAFGLEQLHAAQRALAAWHGEGSTAEFALRIVDVARRQAAAAGGKGTDGGLEAALSAAASAQEARGAFGPAFELLHERAELIRSRVLSEPTPEDFESLCDALTQLGGAAGASSEHSHLQADLYAEVVELRRRRCAEDQSVESRRALANALATLGLCSGTEQALEIEREETEIQECIADLLGTVEANDEATMSMFAYADSLDGAGRNADAEAVRDRALARLRGLHSQLGEASSADSLAGALYWFSCERGKAGDLDGQQRLLLEAQSLVESADDAGGSRGGHLAALDIVSDLARNAAARGDWVQAREHCLRAEGLMPRSEGGDSITALRAELAARVPPGTQWLEVAELLEDVRRAEDDELTLLRAHFMDPATRSVEVGRRLAQELFDRSCDRSDRGQLAEAEAMARECQRVEEWLGKESGDVADLGIAALDILRDALEKSGRLDEAYALALEAVEHCRHEAAMSRAEDWMSIQASMLEHAADLADAKELWDTGRRLVEEWLAVERRLAQGDRDSDRSGNVLPLLGRLAGYARRAGDWPRHDALQQERLSLSVPQWQADGFGEEMFSAALGLLESACDRGDRAAAAESAEVIRNGVRSIRDERPELAAPWIVRDAAAAARALSGRNIDLATEVLAELAATRQSLAPPAWLGEQKKGRRQEQFRSALLEASEVATAIGATDIAATLAPSAGKSHQTLEEPVGNMESHSSTLSRGQIGRSSLDAKTSGDIP